MVKSSQQQQNLKDPSYMVKDYLQKTNRPYSATDLHNNLKQAVPKSQILKALQDLVDTNVICQKTYGKQSVFVFNQQDLHFDSKELDGNLKAINELSASELPELRKALSAVSSELSALNAQPTTQDARGRLKELQALDGQLSSLQQMARKRKRIVQDIINCMTEASEISPSALMDEIGIEKV